MKVTKLIVKLTDGREEDSIIKLMPDLLHEQMWETFYDTIDGTVISQRTGEKLLSLTGDTDSENFIENRDTVRQALSQLTQTVEYEDLYGKTMPTLIKELTWFDRNGP
jgi:hypothetical protein